MNCEEQKERISLFIDGELETVQQVDLFKHLAACYDCQFFLDSMLKFREMRRSECVAFPGDLDEVVLSELTSRKAAYNHVGDPTRTRISFWKRRWAVPVPLAVGLGILVLILGIVSAGTLIRNAEQEGPWKTYFTSGQGTVQQPKVIIIYGMPQVEVFGSLSTKTNQQKNSVIY